MINATTPMTHRIIKKYPNRRLYDTQESKYITLTNLKNLIIGGAYIKIVDSTSNEDITRSILLQIIIEAESAGEPMFSAETLQQIICFYGGTLQGMFAKYLEQSLQLFTHQQPPINDPLAAADPLSAMTRMAEQNMAAWAKFQNNFFDPTTPSDNEDKS
jgi:polyhydroxyalkanoate synthesis repressor PhaR